MVLWLLWDSHSSCPVGLIFGHFATGGVVEALRCDACRLVLPSPKKSITLFDFWPFGHLVTGSVMGPLRCLACIVVLLCPAHSVALTFETIKYRNTSAFVFSYGYYARVIQVAHRFLFLPIGHSSDCGVV